MDAEKIKRDREQNWGRDEKEMLRQLVQDHILVVEDKGNDLKMIKNKKLAWEAIGFGMVSAGYHRSVDKIRKQWIRMKVSAKKAKTANKKAVTATGNNVYVTETNSIDLLVQGMIAEQLEEDSIFIDSNSALPTTAPSNTRPIAASHPISPHENFSDLICYSPSATSVISRAEADIGSYTAIVADNSVAPEPSMPTPVAPSIMPTPVAPRSSRNLLGALKNLPKKPTTKCEVMAERRVQIKKEIARSDELHELQMALVKELLVQAKEASAQAREVHVLRIKKMNE